MNDNSRRVNGSLPCALHCGPPRGIGLVFNTLYRVEALFSTLQSQSRKLLTYQCNINLMGI